MWSCLCSSWLLFHIAISQNVIRWFCLICMNFVNKGGLFGDA